VGAEPAPGDRSPPISLPTINNAHVQAQVGREGNNVDDAGEVAGRDGVPRKLCEATLDPGPGNAEALAAKHDAVTAGLPLANGDGNQGESCGEVKKDSGTATDAAGGVGISLSATTPTLPGVSEPERREHVIIKSDSFMTSNSVPRLTASRGDVSTQPAGIASVQKDQATTPDSILQPGQPAIATPESQLLYEAAQSKRRKMAPDGSAAVTATVLSGSPSPPSQILTGRPDDVIDLDTVSRLASRRQQPSPDGKNNSTSQRSAQGSVPQRPPMRIDTAAARSHSNGTIYSHLDTPTTLTTARTPGHVSPPERMITRFSSGAIRHKSVSEILGETPRTATATSPSVINNALFSPDSMPTRRNSQALPSPGIGHARTRSIIDLKDRERDRSKLSTVIFSKQQPIDESEALEIAPVNRSFLLGNKDYLVPLFLAQSTAGQTIGLTQLLTSSRKTLSTANHYVDFREVQDCRVLKKIYYLQSKEMWSLRQKERGVEPTRPASHWDALLTEVKWMRTDFREERKWKLAMAKNLADWCTEWSASEPGERSALQVKIKKPTPVMNGTHTGVTPVSLPAGASRKNGETTPELMASKDDDVSELEQDEVQPSLVRPFAPAAVFTLAPEDVLFGLHHSPISEKLLAELPMYEPFADLRRRSLGISNHHMDETWRKPIVPVSKFAEGKIVFPQERPRRKKSRYDFSPEPEGNHEHAALRTEQNDIAMFRPENRHLITRLHAAHAFRLPAPTEYPMPHQSFFECRQPSQWTRSEDDELRRLVKDYSFNWPLISSCLASSSIYASGAERRTPWECFERWVVLDSVPVEWARAEYYKRWQSRRSQAKLRHEEQFLAQQQSAAAGAHIQPRRRSGEPISVDRRRNIKYLALVNAMSKVAKKKEATIQKQQHSNFILPSFL